MLLSLPHRCPLPLKRDTRFLQGSDGTTVLFAAHAGEPRVELQLLTGVVEDIYSAGVASGIIWATRRRDEIGVL